MNTNDEPKTVQSNACDNAIIIYQIDYRKLEISTTDRRKKVQTAASLQFYILKYTQNINKLQINNNNALNGKYSQLHLSMQGIEQQIMLNIIHCYKHFDVNVVMLKN